MKSERGENTDYAYLEIHMPHNTLLFFLCLLVLFLLLLTLLFAFLFLHLHLLLPVFSLFQCFPPFFILTSILRAVA